ncbi:MULTISPECIES: hypothetical protein [Sulfitobacter]|uniref:hypothetical protein n=1 Tax=Sulfitobacter TaxID=60136 RepID=UPI002458D054|nr:hypothetical protein [Sulfitobacter faviae]MDH4541077.1 hypothetical protein [Sulfitobacter faviae]
MAEYQNAEVAGPSPLMMMLDFAAIIDGPNAETPEGQRVERAYLATMDQIVELSDSIEAFCASLKE